MKNHTVWAAIGLMMATAGMTACSIGEEDVLKAPQPEENVEQPWNEDNERMDIQLTRSEQQLVEGSNDFAFNLFRQVVVADKAGSGSLSGKSAILSPISITYALGMLNNGAAGQTQAQINDVLGFGRSGADSINAFCRKMLTEAPRLDKLTKVLIANTIYMNKGYELLPAFKEKAKTYYDAVPETRDFYDGKTMDVINQWASDHTEKMITKVLNEESFDPDAVSYLLNAIYFKGAWAVKFDSGNTRSEAFGSTGKKVPMMHQEHEFDYADNDVCQLLRLPYGNSAYAMTILLPYEGKTIDEVLKGLTAKEWNDMQYMGTALVDVKMPRFESNTDIVLNDIMSRLGMPAAFEDGQADFSAFCDEPTYIALMKQVARIKLNEEGTEAAAVTVIGMDNKASGPQEPKRIEFYANRPFLYVISEKSTGAVFFIGQYMGD